MAQVEDPLVAFVAAEALRIERELDVRFERSRAYLRFELGLAELAEADAELRSFRWRYRYTWQEAERARRYVWRLPLERALAARRAVEERMDALLRSRLEVIGSGADAVVLPLAVSAPAVVYREGLQAYEVSVLLRVGGLVG